MKNNGFTLIETIIYIALFGVLMSGALVTIYALLGSVESNQRFEAAYSEGLFINKKIAWELSFATDVVVMASGTLSIIRPDGVVSLMASSSRWWLQVGGGTALPVSSPEYIVSNVLFTSAIPTLDIPTRVSVQYQIKGVPFSYVTYIQH